MQNLLRIIVAAVIVLGILSFMTTYTVRFTEKAVVTTFGRDFATVYTEFTRASTPRIGRQSQTWVRMPDGWKVVAAHVSLMESPR